MHYVVSGIIRIMSYLIITTTQTATIFPNYATMIIYQMVFYTTQGINMFVDIQIFFQIILWPKNALIKTHLIFNVSFRPSPL